MHDFLPGRREDQRADARQCPGIADLPPARVEIKEPAAAPAPRDAERIGLHVCQAVSLRTPRQLFVMSQLVVSPAENAGEDRPFRPSLLWRVRRIWQKQSQGRWRSSARSPSYLRPPFPRLQDLAAMNVSAPLEVRNGCLSASYRGRVADPRRRAATRPTSLRRERSPPTFFAPPSHTPGSRSAIFRRRAGRPACISSGPLRM